MHDRLEGKYQGPDLRELLRRAKKLRSRYENNNPVWLELITLIETVHNFIEKLSAFKTLFSPQKFHEVCLGAWIVLLEKIAQARQYYFVDPKFAKGKIFNSGSTLYTFSLEELGIDKDHFFLEKDKLKYLKELYHFLYTYFDNLVDEKSLQEIIQEKKLVHLQLKSDLILIMQSVLARESTEKNRLLKVIPPEKVIDASMGKLYEHYLEKEKSSYWYMTASDPFLAKLAAALCKLNPPNDGKEETASFLPHSLRVKLGILLYIMLSIEKQNWLPGNSILYNLCKETLKESFPHINDALKLECLSECRNYLKDHENRIKLEDYMNEYFPDKTHIYMGTKLDDLDEKIEALMKNITYNQSPHVSKVTKVATAVGALAGMFIGHPVGFAIGYSAGLIDPANTCKEKLTPLTRYAMKVIFSDAGEYLGYFASDLILDETLEFMFSKLFEALGGVIGAAGLGITSLGVADLSYQGARELYRYIYQLDAELETNFIKNIDLDFIETLLDLPDEVFSKDEKKKLSNTTGKTSSLGLLSHPPAELTEEVRELSFTKSFVN